MSDKNTHVVGERLKEKCKEWGDKPLIKGSGVLCLLWSEWQQENRDHILEDGHTWKRETLETKWKNRKRQRGRRKEKRGKAGAKKESNGQWDFLLRHVTSVQTHIDRKKHAEAVEMSKLPEHDCLTSLKIFIRLFFLTFYDLNLSGQKPGSRRLVSHQEMQPEISSQRCCCPSLEETHLNPNICSYAILFLYINSCVKIWSLASTWKSSAALKVNMCLKGENVKNWG